MKVKIEKVAMKVKITAYGDARQDISETATVLIPTDQVVVLADILKVAAGSGRFFFEYEVLER